MAHICSKEEDLVPEKQKKKTLPWESTKNMTQPILFFDETVTVADLFLSEVLGLAWRFHFKEDLVGGLVGTSI